MRESLSPKQVARAIGVSESSLKRWCDKGLLHPIRTAGGHRRLPLAEVIEFLRLSGQELARPELLGLPSLAPGGVPDWPQAQADFREAICRGDEATCRRIVFELYLAGHGVVELGDRLVAATFQEVGSRWEHGSLQVFAERRAVEIAVRLLVELRAALGPPKPTAPLAIGASPEGDPYRLATTLVELSLREAGWQAESYGAGIPLESLASAVRTSRPRLVWLSVSYLPDERHFRSEYARLFETAQSHGAALAVGGQALTGALRRQLRYSAYCENLQQLADFAHSIWHRPQPALQAG